MEDTFKERGKIKNGWNIIFRHLLKQKEEIAFISVLGIVSAIANGSVPYLVGRFLDEISGSHFITLFKNTIPLWLFFLTVWAIVQIIANVTSWSIDIKSRKLGTFIEGSYFADAFSSLLFLPISFHKNRKTGEGWDRIYRAANALSGMIQGVIIGIAPELLSVLIGFGIAFFIHPYLALVLMGGVIVYIGMLIKILPPIVILQKKAHGSYNRAFGDAHDALSNITAVKQSGAEEYEQKKMQKKFVDIAAAFWYKLEKIWGNITFFQRLTIFLTQLAVFILSVYFVQQGSLTIGELIALNGYAMLIFGPFVRLGFNWQILQSGIVAIERAEAIITSTSEEYSSRGKASPKAIRGEIEFKHVSFSYKRDEQRVLNDINVMIKPGEIIALVGRSGVGKSTFIELLSGYYFPEKGKIFVDGYDIRHIGLQFLRSHIAVVPQEIALFNDSIKNNIRYGSFKASDSDIEKAAKEAHADIFIEKFPKKFNQIVGERGIKLSVGQKQRIAIARAILRNPKILILDEPTSALDAETEKYITESLQKLMKGRTTFIIAHRLSTVRHAHRILVFEKGKIAEEGNHEDLIQKENGIYRKLYGLHVGLHK